MTVVAGWLIAAFVADSSAVAVEVTGTSTCPAAADVAAALSGLVGPEDPEAETDRATLSENGSSVVVALRRASGEPVGEKPLDAGLSCDQRARAAAVVIAAWEARLAPPAAPLVVPKATPIPRRAAIVVDGEVPSPTGSAGPARNLELGVSAGGSMDGTTLAPEAAIEAALVRPGALVIPAVAALIVGAHTKPVGPGAASWRRYGLLATIASRRSWQPVWTEVRTGVALTLLDISGSSFSPNGGGVTFDPGIELGFRLGVRASRVLWWLDGALALWPRGQEVYVHGGPGSASLPLGQALVSLGASYGAAETF